MADLTPLDRAIRAARRGHNEAARRLLDDVLAADPSDERALAWRARIEDDPAVKRGLLDRVLAITPDARWATDALAALGDGESAAAAPTTLGDVGTTAETIHHLQCPNCGGQVEIHPDRGSKAVVCTHCSSVLDLTAAQAAIIGSVKKKWTPAQDILPGAEFTLDGVRHLVIGWLRYKGWDDESSWTWDEWQMVGDDGAVRYLSWSSDEGFLLQTPIRPTPRVKGRKVELSDGSVRFHEVSPAKITHMAGELTWRPGIGQTLQTGEAKRKGVHYSAELTADEIEVVGGPKMKSIDVWRALSRKDKIEEHEARIAKAKARRARARRTAMLWLAAALLFGTLATLSKGWGETIAEQTVEVEIRPFTMPAAAQEATLVRFDTLDLGQIQSFDHAVTATVTASPPVAAPLGLVADVGLVTADSSAFTIDVPPLVGSGEVTETSTPHTFSDWRRPAEPMRLALLVRREWWTGSTWQPWTETATVPVTVEVRRVWASGPFYTALVVSLFFALCFFLFSRSSVKE